MSVLQVVIGGCSAVVCVCTVCRGGRGWHFIFTRRGVGTRWVHVTGAPLIARPDHQTLDALHICTDQQRSQQARPAPLSHLPASHTTPRHTTPPFNNTPLSPPSPTNGHYHVIGIRLGGQQQLGGVPPALRHHRRERQPRRLQHRPHLPLVDAGRPVGSGVCGVCTGT